MVDFGSFGWHQKVGQALNPDHDGKCNLLRHGKLSTNAIRGINLRTEPIMAYIRSIATVMMLTVAPALAWATAPMKGIAWSTWSGQLFDRASREHKFVLLSLGNQWCRDCHDMEADTYADETVQELIEKRYVAVRVDNSARPDLANRYWSYGVPGVVIFNSDGGEIVREGGYMSPREMSSLLQAVIDDPSPGPSVKPEPVVQYSSSPVIDTTVLRELRKSFESAYDIPAQGWAFAVQYLDSEFVEYGLTFSGDGGRVDDRYLRFAIQRSRQLIDPTWGGVYQSLVVPVSENDGHDGSQFIRIQIGGRLDATGDSWNAPLFEKTASTQAEAMEIYAAGYRRWHDREDLAAALHVAAYVKYFLQDRDGGFYAGQAGYVERLPDSEKYFSKDDRGRRELGIPTIDKHIYARENGRLIAGLCKLYLITSDRSFLQDAERSAQWVIKHRALPGGGFSHSYHDDGGPYLVDSLEMGRAFLALYMATHSVSWLKRAESACDFIAKTIVKHTTSGVLSSASATDARYKPHANREENATLASFASDLVKLTGSQRDRDLAVFAMRFLVTKEIAESNLPAPILLATTRYMSIASSATVPGN
jgi:uncharacterized protein